MLKIYSGSESMTVKTGEILGSCLENGDIVCLEGDLGSGKTVFVKGIAKGLGINREITSPTFVLVNEYKGEKTLYHFDVYRIENPEDFLDSGLDEYFDGTGIAVVEWADRITDILPPEHIKVVIKRGQEDDSRVIEVSFRGNGYRKTEMEFKDRMEASR
jgi:tRNA threonylcarbamoyladenosine biosynthesis protein TsaE